MEKICVYCGSSDRINSVYLQAAQDIGAAIASRSWKLVYGAGRTGLMGRVADGALANGGEVLGVIPKQFLTPQLAHDSLTSLEVVDNMHTRKARMAELADAFIALPGGYGTFEELFEILTWAQIGLHRKPIGLLNVEGYFNPLIQLINHAHQEGFIYEEHRLLLVQSASAESLLDLLADYQPPTGLERWVNRDD